MDDAARYIAIIVEPTVRDFEGDSTSVRLAFLASVAVFHTLDYIARASGQPSAHLRQVFRNESADFALVDRVAHAFKHVSVGPPDNPNLLAVDIVPRPLALWDGALWDLSRWDDAEGGVTVDRDRSVNLLQTLRNATEFLQSKASLRMGG